MAAETKPATEAEYKPNYEELLTARGKDQELTTRAHPELGPVFAHMEAEAIKDGRLGDTVMENTRQKIAALHLPNLLEGVPVHEVGQVKNDERIIKEPGGGTAEDLDKGKPGDGDAKILGKYYQVEGEGKNAGKMYFREAGSNKLAFVDEGHQLRVTMAGAGPTAAAMEYAKDNKGWAIVEVGGSTEWRREAWAQGRHREMQVNGIDGLKVGDTQAQLRLKQLQKRELELQQLDQAREQKELGDKSEGPGSGKKQAEHELVT